MTLRVLRSNYIDNHNIQYKVLNVRVNSRLHVLRKAFIIYMYNIIN
jgi:hypothetical protein